MATLAIDLDGVLGSLSAGAPDEGMPDGTVMGHVHLQVRDIAEAERFYAGCSASTSRSAATRARSSCRPAATTTTSGSTPGRHAGAPRRPPAARGLDRYRVDLPARADVDAAAARLADAGHVPVPGEDGLRVTDPSGNAMVLAAP